MHAGAAVVMLALALAGQAPGSGGPCQTAPARVVILVEDEGESPLPCRIHLKDARGKPQRPRTGPFWYDHFDTEGRAELELPAGVYTYEVEHGPEFSAAAGEIRATPDGVKPVSVRLARLADMAAEGWWSGDLHVHRPVDEMPLLLRAEDLHMAPTITWWNDRTAARGKNPAATPLLTVEGNRFSWLLSGEDERDGGALLYFHLETPLPLKGSGREYPPPLAFVAQARQQKGVWIDAEKPFWYDLPVWLASGAIDSIGLANNHMVRDRMFPGEAWGRPRDMNRLPEPLGNGYWSQEVYYHVLNCGLRIPPSAGSASGVLPNPVGYDRVYVHAEAPLTYEAWWEALRAGRSFVTNGPLLRVKANGEWPGHVFACAEGKPLKLELEARLTSRDPIRAVEIIQNGKVVRTIPGKEWAHNGKLGSLEFTSSGWFLVRVLADVPNTFRFASTAPFYVEAGPARRRVSRASAQFFLDWVNERIARVHVDDPAQREEVLKYHRKARVFWTDLLAKANAD